jgi:hypothetical protein
MDKSIEATWREGFLRPDALVAPAINDLYGRRSVHLVAKMQRMFRINRWAVAIGAPVQWLFLSAVGIPSAGAIICALLWALIAYQTWYIGEMREPDSSLNSFEYVKAFQRWLKDRMARARRVQRHLYPLVFLAIMVGTAASDTGQAVFAALAENYPGLSTVGGVPLVLVAGVLAVTAVIALLGGKIYDFDVNTVYRPVFRKLDEMVADMEELRADGGRTSP